jgi:hypothetical protein
MFSFNLLLLRNVEQKQCRSLSLSLLSLCVMFTVNISRTIGSHFVVTLRCDSSSCEPPAHNHSSLLTDTPSLLVISIVTMCLGIQPVFLPSSQCAKKSAIRDGTNHDADPPPVSASPPAPDPASNSTGNSRKRPLHEKGNTDRDASPAYSYQPNRKTMRYSSCTCPCENGDCKRNSKRKVRFGSFTTSIPAAYSFTDEERKDLWYGLDECAAMNEVSKARVKEIRSTKENKDTLRHILCVASQCSYSPPPLAYLQTVRLQFADETRGLELGLLPLRIRQRRQEHVRRVVEVQTHIVSGKIPLKNDENVKAKALAIQSLRSSQASRLLAELLARNVAADVQQAALGIVEES